MNSRALLSIVIIVPLLAIGVAPAVADTGPLDVAVDTPSGSLVSSSVNADPAATAVATTPLYSFPRAGASYAILSTGLAAEVPGGSPEDLNLSTELEGDAGGADGNDLTSFSLTLVPPPEAQCIAFDFQFLSEEYPEFVGSPYNDIFTAELNESVFTVEDNQVISPNNFAYDIGGNFISVNTVLGFTDSAGTRMDGTTSPLVAVSPIETKLDGTLDLILSIQDLGDSIYDSAVLVDNLRWLYEDTCERGVTSLTDIDGDGLPDLWETEGIDYDNDGTPELDLPALGADPERADVFLEVDWMTKPESCFIILCWGGQSFAPNQDALNDVVAAFAAAPRNNPDGSTGITMHIDAGPASPHGAGTWGPDGHGNEVGWDENLGSMTGVDYDWSEFDSVKTTHFDPVRADAFHYVVYGDQYAESGSSGISRGIPGADFIVTDGHPSWGSGFSRIQERGTFMHEFGHNLSLMHGGPDSVTYQNDPTYESVMNYLYQLVGIGAGNTLDYSRGTPYDDWSNVRFDGGAVGDLGDVADPTFTEEHNELTPEIAKDDGIFAIDGDGVTEFVGPNVIVAAAPDQALTFTVLNLGTSTTDYTLSASLADGTAVGASTATIVGGASATVPLLVNATTLGVGDVEITVTTTSALLGEIVDEDVASLAVVDLTDSQTILDLQNDLEDAAQLPEGEGPSPAALQTVIDLVEDADVEPVITRIVGVNRYDTSARIAQRFDTGQVDVVYVANGQTYPDALSAAPAAGVLGGPLLLTQPNALPSQVVTEIQRLQPGRIVVVGGPTSVSASVETALEALYGGTQVERIAGVNRYETSRLITEDMFAGPDASDVFIATGKNFPDALSAAGAAAYLNGPVILVDGTAAQPDAATYATLDALEATTVRIAGGPPSISAGIETSLIDSFGDDNVHRLAGANRYETGVAINNAIFTGADTVFLAAGTSFPDALAGSALAGATGSPLFVVRATCVPEGVLAAIDALGPTEIVVLGGPTTLSPEVFSLTPCAP